MPRIAKIVKKKTARPMIPPKAIIDLKRISTSICIDLTLLSVRSGRKRRRILKKDTLLTYCSSKDETTTVKSSQFHESFR